MKRISAVFLAAALAAGFSGAAVGQSGNSGNSGNVGNNIDNVSFSIVSNVVIVTIALTGGGSIILSTPTGPGGGASGGPGGPSGPGGPGGAPTSVQAVVAALLTQLEAVGGTMSGPLAMAITAFVRQSLGTGPGTRREGAPR